MPEITPPRCLLLLLCASALWAQEAPAWGWESEDDARIFELTRVVERDEPPIPELSTRRRLVVRARDLRDGRRRHFAPRNAVDELVLRALLAATVERGRRWEWEGELEALRGALAFTRDRSDPFLLRFEGRVHLAAETVRALDLRNVSLLIAGECTLDRGHGGLDRFELRLESRWEAENGRVRQRVETLRSAPARRASFAASESLMVASARGFLRSWLEEQELGGFQSPEPSALVGFALLHGAESADSLALQAVRAVDALSRNGGSGILTTYALALLAQAYEAADLRREPAGAGSVPRYQRRGSPDRLALGRLAALLLRRRRPGTGSWGYGPQFFDIYGEDYGDNSNSQFAILALHSVQRCGFALPPDLWAEVDRWYRAGTAEVAAPREPLPVGWRQLSGQTAVPGDLRPRRARGWGYLMAGDDALIRRLGLDSVYGSMTAAGLSSLAVTRDVLGLGNAPADLVADATVNEGLAALWALSDSRAPDMGNRDFAYYGLYSVEKALDLLNVETLHGYDWHDGLSACLLELQHEDGSFEANRDFTPGPGQDASIATSFALLFLHRVALVNNAALTPALPPARIATGVDDAPEPPPAPAPELLIAGAWRPCAALAEVGGTATIAELDRALGWILAADLPACVPGLLALVAAEDRREAWAREVLEAIVAPRRLRDGTAEEVHAAWLRLAAEAGAGLATEVRGLLEDRKAPHCLRALAARRAPEVLGPDAVEPLLEAMEASDPGLRDAAAAALRVLPGRVVGFDAWATRAERKASLKVWRRWLRDDPPGPP